MISDKAIARASLAIAKVYVHNLNNIESEAKWIASVIKLCVEDETLRQKIATGSTPATIEIYDTRVGVTRTGGLT